MKKLTLAAIALSAIATSLVATPAATASGTATGPEGRRCGYAAASDPNPEADANDMTGEISAGPATTTTAGTMICTIQVNSNTHDGPDAASREFPSDSNGIIAGAQTVTYSTAEDAQDYMCTSFRRTDGTTIYWTVDSDGNGHWHTTPNVPCSAATQFGTQDVWDVIDGAVCPELIKHHPHAPPANSPYIDNEGDIFVDIEGDGIAENYPNETDSGHAMFDLFYDCPIYTFTINDDSNPDAQWDAHPNPNNQTYSPSGGKVIDF